MRQLVSVVTDQTISYFLTQEDPDQPVQQVAQILNTGLEVPDVIDLGSNLLGALKLNGHRHRKPVAAPAPTPELPPAPAPAAKRMGRPPGPAKRPIRRWGFTKDNVLADLRAHPGTTYAEAAMRIAGTDEAGAKQAYSSTLGAMERDLLREGATVERETFNASTTGKARLYVRLTLLERGRSPQPEEPEQ